MKRFFLVSLSFALLAALLYWGGERFRFYLEHRGLDAPNRQMLKKIHSPAINFSLPYWDKAKNLSLEELRGKAIILHFWATWCFPCIEEFPELIKIAERYKASGLALIAISLDRNKKDIERFFMRYPKLRKASQYFHILMDPKAKLAMQYNAHTQVPKTFLIDRNFILQYQLSGAQNWTSPYFKPYYEHILQEVPQKIPKVNKN